MPSASRAAGFLTMGRHDGSSRICHAGPCEWSKHDLSKSTRQRFDFETSVRIAVQGHAPVEPPDGLKYLLHLSSTTPDEVG